MLLLFTATLIFVLYFCFILLIGVKWSYSQS